MGGYRALAARCCLSQAEALERAEEAMVVLLLNHVPYLSAIATVESDKFPRLNDR